MPTLNPARECASAETFQGGNGLLFPEPEEIDLPRVITEHRFDWRGIGITVQYEAEWLGGDYGHLGIYTDGRVPVPLTSTGYRSHFQAGECDPVEIATLLLDQAAGLKRRKA